MAVGTLLAPLSSGFSDAPSGTAFAFRRGTDRGTTVSMYSDPEATASLGTSHGLNAAGRLRAYVTEEAEIVIYDADGNEVWYFETGQAAEMVGLESASFTGTLASGSQGAGGLVGLQSALTRIVSSFGTVDGKVIPSGQTTAQNLKAILAITSGLPFYDITAAAYGAVGDDSTDNRTAIQNAIAAATAAGGGIVFVPAGVFRISSPLTITGKVKILGVSPTGSQIKAAWAAASNESIATIDSGATAECGVVLEDISLVATHATPPRLLTAGANATGAELRNVTFVTSGGTSPSFKTIELSSSTRVHLYNCYMQSVNNGRLFTGTGTEVYGGSYKSVDWGPYTGTKFMGGIVTTMIFSNSLSGTFGAILGTDITTCAIAFAGHLLDLSSRRTSGMTAGTEAETVWGKGFINFDQVRNTSNPATYAPDPLYGWQYVETNANITLSNVSAGFTRGRAMLVTIKNTSAGPITVTYDTEYIGGDATIAAGKYATMLYVRDTTLAKWIRAFTDEV